MKKIIFYIFTFFFTRSNTMETSDNLFELIKQTKIIQSLEPSYNWEYKNKDDSDYVKRKMDYTKIRMRRKKRKAYNDEKRKIPIDPKIPKRITHGYFYVDCPFSSCKKLVSGGTIFRSLRCRFKKHIKEEHKNSSMTIEEIAAYVDGKWIILEKHPRYSSSKKLKPKKTTRKRLYS